MKVNFNIMNPVLKNNQNKCIFQRMCLKKCFLNQKKIYLKENILKISNQKKVKKSKNINPLQKHFELNMNVILLTIINPIINKTQKP